MNGRTQRMLHPIPFRRQAGRDDDPKPLKGMGGPPCR